jgi:hypothetical protein
MSRIQNSDVRMSSITFDSRKLTVSSLVLTGEAHVRIC